MQVEGPPAHEEDNTMTETTTCECNADEYEPCKAHSETLVQRDGASVRTADDLLLTYCLDGGAVLGDEASPWSQGVEERAWSNMDREGDMGCHWLTDDVEGEALRDELQTLANQIESSLASMDRPALTVWDDGFRIVRITGGPLLED